MSTTNTPYCAANVNVTVNVNVQHANPNRKPQRKKLRDEDNLHEFYSKDGWSWMGVRAQLILPYRFFQISVELQVRREFFGNWIYEKEGMKQLEIVGKVYDPNGTVLNIKEFGHLDGGTYSRVFDYGESGWMGPVTADLWVKKSHGYWANSGPDSHTCEGTINSWA